MMPQIPQQLETLYWLVGFLVVANLASIGSVLYIGFKIVWWASQVDSRIEGAEKKLDDHQEAIRTLEHAYR